MIYEIRTYDLLPHSLPEVEKRFGEAYEKRKKISPLAAFFHTEIGPLNQIIHIWPYKDMEERNRLREEAPKACNGNWPPKIAEFIVSQRTDFFVPFAGGSSSGRSSRSGAPRSARSTSSCISGRTSP
jgi:hypothetical protein